MSDHVESARERMVAYLKTASAGPEAIQACVERFNTTAPGTLDPQWAEELAANEAALEVLEIALGPDRRSVAELLRTLGVLYAKMDMWSAAARAHARADTILREAMSGRTETVPGYIRNIREAQRRAGGAIGSRTTAIRMENEPRVGIEIYFTGDGGAEGFGRITALHPAEGLIPRMFDIELDDGRIMAVASNAFDPSKTERKWWTKAEWERRGEER